MIRSKKKSSVSTYRFTRFFAGALFVGLLAAGTTSAAPEKPNIVIVFTDDQGYADLACYGNKKNKTPRLDQLAREGTRFTSFYSQTVCGPSRSALLTGRHPIRSKGWGMPASEITIAERMRENG
ncbi:MAG: sulfatase-like hydrolase/transferase, partial [Verrucomicrobiota bacterium]